VNLETLEANTNCPDSTDACNNLVGNTVAGTRPGQPKAALCREILDCMHSTHCAKPIDNQSTPTDCLCGVGVTPGDCFDVRTFDQLTGACKDVIAAGAETTDLSKLKNLFFDSSNPAGAAEGILETCDGNFCIAQCL